MSATTDKPLVDIPLYSSIEFDRYFITHPFLVGFFPNDDSKSQFSFRVASHCYIRSIASRVLLGLARTPEDFWTPFRTTLAIDRPTLPDTLEEDVSWILEDRRPFLDDASFSAFKKSLWLCLQRFDFDGSTPVRLYPFTRDHLAASPRTIVIDPAIRFGKPTITGHAIPTDILISRFQAGDSVHELAEDYDLSTDQIEEAIRYELSLPTVFAPIYLD